MRPRRLPRLHAPLLVIAIAVAEYAPPWRPAGRAATLALAALLVARFVQQSLRHFGLSVRIRAVLRARFVELGFTAAALALLVSKASVWARQLANPPAAPALEPAYAQYAAAFLLVAGFRAVAGDLTVRRALHRLDLQPAQTVALGFAGTVLAGTLLLSLPLAVTRLERLSLLDALFTATSAVTTTGLIVYEPTRFHTPFGQVVLLALIQLGGLGTMAVSASLVALAGRRLRLQRTAALQEQMDLQTLGEVRGRLKAIVGITVAVEAAGAAALYAAWHGRGGVEGSVFHAVFFAVSAFCTAGFSSFEGGLIPFRDDLATTAIIGVLMVLGGLGFPVMAAFETVIARLRSRHRAPRLTLNARLALLTTALLLAGGALAVAALEWGGAFASLGWPSRLLAAAFLAATSQSTTGFNTVDTAALAPATLWLLVGLMFVGGSPGSTAGGIKTTAAATVVATLWATLRGRPQVEAFRRTIPDEQVAKALALVGLSMAVVATAVTTLLATQAGAPLALAFEAVSAFGTVGLSAGVTPTLNGAGKAVIIALMFVGRTGPLTLGFALAARSRPVRVVFPPEKIMLG